MKIVQSEFFQAAWVVDDIDRAMRDWLSHGVGPFLIIREPQLSAFSYRGKPMKLNFGVALAQSGPMQIELIQQYDAQPSHYRDAFKPGESGFHHVCRFTPDYDADMANYAKRDIETAATGVSGDMRFAYLDTRRDIGVMTEIIEDREGIRGLFKMVADAAINWDGKDPIREI